MAGKKARKREWLDFNRAIVLLLIISLFIILKTAFTPQKTELLKEAEIVLDTLTDDYTKVSLVESNELIEEKIRNLDSMDYNEAKNVLGVEGDFCIFFEDATGNLVRIDNINSGIGSNKIYINGEPCK
jgi:hypothetical protein